MVGIGSLHTICPVCGAIAAIYSEPDGWHSACGICGHTKAARTIDEMMCDPSGVTALSVLHCFKTRNDFDSKAISVFRPTSEVNRLEVLAEVYAVIIEHRFMGGRLIIDYVNSRLLRLAYPNDWNPWTAVFPSCYCFVESFDNSFDGMLVLKHSDIGVGKLTDIEMYGLQDYVKKHDTEPFRLKTVYPVIVGQNAFIYDVHYNEKYNSDLAGFCNDNHINLMVNANRNDTPFVQAVFGMDDKAYRLLSFMDKCSAEEEEQTTPVGWDHSDEDYAWIVTGEDSDDEADDSFGLTGDEKVAGEYRDFEFPSL